MIEWDGAIGGCIAFRRNHCIEHLIKIGGGPTLAATYQEAASPRDYPDGGYVNQLAVFPGYQGRQLGGRLLDVAVAASREAGCDRLYLCVSGFNTAAREFYKRRGFMELGIIENCFRPGNDEHLMRIMI